MTKTSWIKDTKDAANDCEANTSWARDLRRQAMIASRLEAGAANVKVTLPPMPAFMSADISV